MNERIIRNILNTDAAQIAPKLLLLPYQSRITFKRACTSVDHTFSSMLFKGFTGTYNGQRISVIETGMNPSRVGDLVLWLKDIVSHVLFTGSVGTLSEDLEIGDYFIPFKAVDGEGFSHYHHDLPSEQRFYNAHRTSIHPHLQQRCRSFPIKNGTVYTIGSLAAEENTLFLEFLRAQGISALDMETSALYTAAEKTGIQALAFHYVSDRPLEHPFYEKPSNEDQLRLNYAVEGIPKTVMDILTTL